ncbi:MAG TPA: polynucleotide adenylyltransferase PcnB [Spirochaetota bacterium]|nr:polynucleotide adenylyltransferase PcnB [Spirochaetota bacterium]
MKRIKSLITRKGKFPVVLPQREHPIDNKQIERGVIDIMYRLKKNGYKAYLVGGCVRDILLGMPPKDFDIVTDAHPRQIKRLFARCFLIGSRFRLAHVYIAADRFIEVATFRAAVDPTETDDKEKKNYNTFGTIEEDAFRRDFTINSLYYNYADSTIMDYTGGLSDIKKKVLRSIGDPAVRFREDPVRIIRAARFCARFGFRLSKNDYKDAVANASRVAEANANRLLEELYKILRCGASAASFKYMDRFGVLPHWIPEVDKARHNHKLIARLESLDKRRLAGAEIPTSVLITLLFYDIFSDLDNKSETVRGSHESFIAARNIFHPIAMRLRLPRKETDRVLNIVTRQKSFVQSDEGKRNPRFEKKFVRNEHFSDALLFFEILAESAGGCQEDIKYWKTLAAESPDTPAPQARKTEARQDGGRGRRPVHNRPKKISGNSQEQAAVPDSGAVKEDKSEVKKPKRKRRKKPAVKKTSESPVVPQDS